MKLHSLITKHFLSLDVSAFQFTKPVTLFCGHNEVGKTSIANAVSFALTGLPRRADIDKKKDLIQLVTHGQKAGKVTLTIEHDGQQLDYERAVTTGICSQANIDDPWMQCCLDMHRFSGLSPEDRKRLLFGAKPDYEAVLELAVSHFGITKTLLEDYRSWIETGFDAALEKLREDVRELKGEWRGVTGETWGSEKAETWAREAEEPTLTGIDVDDLEAQKATLTQQIAEIAGKHALLAQLEKTANSDKDYRRLLDDLQHEHVRAEEKAFSGQEVLEGVQSCPHCGKALAVSRKKIIAVQLKGTESAQANLKAIEARMEELESQMQAAKIAREQLESARSEIPDSGKLQEQLSEIESLLADTYQADKDWDAYESATEVTRKAAEVHRSISMRIALGKALSPDGIPEILGVQKLDAFNALLDKHAFNAGWPLVRMRSDGEIVRGATPYFLLSESAQWRCDALVTLALAELSEWRMAILDRMDVLDIPGRVQALRWLSKAYTALDTILVMATLKEAPTIAADWLQTIWLERN